MKNNIAPMVLVLTIICIIALLSTNATAAEKSGRVFSTYIEKPPYLVVTSTTAGLSLLWQAATIEDQFVRWRLLDSSSTETATVSSLTSHSVLYRFDFPALMENQRYAYQVQIGKELFDGNFHTPPPATSENLQFFVMGDTRSNTGPIDIFSRKMVEMMRADNRWQTLVVHTGDWVAVGNNEDYWNADFFGPQWPNRSELHSLIPFVGVKGNHDYGTLYRKYFPFPFEEESLHYWSLDYGPVHFTFLDLYDPETNAWLNISGSKQHVWLKNDLKSSKKKWKIVVLHEPAFSLRSDRTTHPEIASLLLPVCANNGVNLIINGHDHMYIRSKQMGVYHVTAAGGGAPIYTPDPQRVIDHNIDVVQASWHFCAVDVKNETLTFRAFNTANEEIDAFVIDTPPPLLPFPALLVY